MKKLVEDKLKALRCFARDFMNFGLRYAINKRFLDRHYMTRVEPRVSSMFAAEDFPTLVEIEVTTVCNLKCRICEHSYWHEKSQHMPFDKFKSIVDQFPGLRWIGLTGIGESFMHPDFLRMIELVKSRGAMLELYDTFYFIDEKTARFLLEKGCDKLIISLDAATPETYSKIRIGSDFERVTGNLRRMFALKKEGGYMRPELEFHFIVNSINKHEMPAFVDLAKSISGGDTRIMFTRMLHPYAETMDLFTEVSPEQKAQVDAVAKRLSMKVAWSVDTTPDEAKPFCSFCSAWIMPFIFVTGEVIPCCSANEANRRDEQKHLAMGNVFETSMERIWNGDNYKKLRASLREGRFTEPCRNCCIYREKEMPRSSN